MGRLNYLHRPASPTADTHPLPEDSMLFARLTALIVGALALSGCATQPLPLPAPGPVVAPPPAPVVAAAGPRDASSTARAFVGVLSQMEPAVERECLARRRTPINCDFQFVVVDDPNAELNAFQEVDRQGRPIIGFTLALIAAARNSDELAFVVGHEASHHILEHITQKTASARQGAILFGALATASGADAVAVRTAQNAGAQFGARYYSKEWELQSDYMGAVITALAGYDPVNGAQFFMRIPDPGDRVLGSHPARADRIAAVNRAMADLRSGRVR